MTREWGRVLCSIDNCNKKHLALNYCKRHYRMFKKYGDPNKFQKNRNESCGVNKCNIKYYSNGYCQPHYYRWKYNGDPLKLKNFKDKICKKKHCNRKHHGKNLCLKHYSIMRQKLYPDKILAIQKRHFEKHGKTFKYTVNQYIWALQSWSKVIKKLDNNMCKKCNSTKNLHAHHIYPKSLFPKLSLDIDNGITLCNKCHWEAHGFKCIR